MNYSEGIMLKDKFGAIVIVYCKEQYDIWIKRGAKVIEDKNVGTVK